MQHLLISIPNDEALAGRLGKKGSVNGLTFYNRKVDDSVFVILTPSNPEAKFNSVAEVITLSDNVLISTTKLDRLFAESIIGCSVLGRKITLTGDGDASDIMQKSKIEYSTVPESGVLDHFKSLGGDRAGAGTRIDVDRAFDVKGIGTVILGIVSRGAVKVHDVLYTSEGKSVGVRSIQAQDQDVDEAGKNARVGLAVKGIESAQIGKGDVLSDTPIKKVNRAAAQITISGMIKERDFEYKELWMVSGFGSSICRVAKSGDNYELSLSSQLSLSSGDSFLLVRKNEPRIFAGGRIL